MKIRNIKSIGTFRKEDFKNFGNISGKKVKAEDEHGKEFEIFVGKGGSDYYGIIAIDGVKGKIFGVTAKFFESIDDSSITERVITQFNSLDDTKLIDIE